MYLSALCCQLICFHNCRLPPAFNDIPTDADYAMELISQRIASGQDVKPSTLKKPRKRNLPQTQNVEASGNDAIISENEPQSIDWKKWGDRAASWKTLVDGGVQLLTGIGVRLSLPFVVRRSNASWGRRAGTIQTYPHLAHIQVMMCHTHILRRAVRSSEYFALFTTFKFNFFQRSQLNILQHQA